MARLLIVTDAVFYRSGAKVLGRSGCDRPAFDDYCAAFDQVRVAARVSTALPRGELQRADGAGLCFVDLQPASGADWLLAPRRRHCAALDEAVDWADALCLRLPGTAGWHAARLARRRAKPVMFELAGDPLAAGPAPWPEGGLQAWRTRWILRRCRLGSYVSASHLQARYPAAPGATTAAIADVRLERAQLRPPRSGRWHGERLSLVHVGGFRLVKNQALLVKALRRAAATGLPVTLQMIGDGPRRALIERRVRAHGLADRVSLTGALPGPDPVMAAMAAADALVMPSRSESLPATVLEAMALGLPVIGSDIPGLRQLLPHWLLFDPAAPASLLERCRMLLDDAAYRRAAAHSSGKVKEFTRDVLAARRHALLAELRQQVETSRNAQRGAMPTVAVVVPGASG